MASKNIATVALVFAIIALFVFCIPYLGLIISIIAFVVSILAILKAYKESDNISLPLVATVIATISLYLAILFVTNDEFNFWKKDNNHLNINDDSLYLDNFDFVDTNAFDVDSALLDNKELNELENTINDKNNSPGNPPE